MDEQTDSGRERAPGTGSAPVGETPVRETPVRETPVDETPVGETPVAEPFGATAHALRRRLPWLGLAAGLLAVLPPYVGPVLVIEQRVEVADHVVPGVVVIALCVAVLLARLPARRSLAMLVAGLVVVLAGIWMTATHVPLLAQVVRDAAPLGASAFHTVTGVLVLAVGLLWSWVCWDG